MGLQPRPHAFEKRPILEHVRRFNSIAHSVGYRSSVGLHFSVDAPRLIQTADALLYPPAFATVSSGAENLNDVMLVIHVPVRRPIPNRWNDNFSE